MKKFHLFSIFFFIYCFSVKAQQNTYPVLAMQVQATPVSNYLNPDSSEYFSDTTVFSAQMLLSLYDTTGITAVHVKIGRTAGGTDVVNATYDFDTNRSGYNINLALGNYSNLLHYYAEIKLERTDATLTDAITFSR